MKNYFNSAAKLLIYPFYRGFFIVRNWGPFWYYGLNRKARALHNRHHYELGAVERRVIADLKRDGAAAVHLDELFPGRDLLSALRRYTADARAQAETKTKKAFLKQLWDVAPTLDPANPFVRLALEPKVIDIVNNYLGMYSIFYYLTLNITEPVAPEAAPVSSQRWHRDPEDKRMCKVFLYVNDVDEGSGPFTYARGSHYGGRYGHIFPQHPPKGTYPNAEAVKRAIPKDEVAPFMGRAGTLVFADTAGLHRGGYATEKERIMFTAGFCSASSVWPFRFVYPAGFDRLVAALPHPAVRYALQRPRPRLASLLFEKLRKVYKYE